MQTEGAVSVEPSGSLMLGHGTIHHLNDDTHNQLAQHVISQINDETHNQEVVEWENGEGFDPDQAFAGELNEEEADIEE